MDTSFSPNADRLVAKNVEYAAHFAEAGADLQVAPTAKLAVVACMDSRMDIFSLLGLENGEAHVIRNAGGVVTDDVVRSLCLSQRALGTREILLVHHTDCGLTKVSEDSFRAELNEELGMSPPWVLEAFTDPFADVRQSILRLQHSPFLPQKDHISGFVYSVADGVLKPVTM